MIDDTNPKDLLGIRKPPLHLVAPALVLWVSKVFGYSAGKYGPYNWREKKVRLSIYLNAIERHLLAMKDGQETDEESGLPHAAHIGANIAVILDARATGNLLNDLTWKPGPAPWIIKELTDDLDDARGNK